MDEADCGLEGTAKNPIPPESVIETISLLDQVARQAYGETSGSGRDHPYDQSVRQYVDLQEVPYPRHYIGNLCGINAAARRRIERWGTDRSQCLPRIGVSSDNHMRCARQHEPA